MTDAEINKAIALHIEPSPEWVIERPDWWFSRGGCWKSEIYTSDPAVRRAKATPRDFITDPAMLSVMLERICKKQPYRGGIELRWWPEAQQYHCIFEDERGATMSEATSLQRAVAMAYLRAFRLE